MTGFARVKRSSKAGEVVITLRSVNHRGLDIQFRTCPEIEVFEPALRELIKQRLSRGHVQVRITFTPARALPVTLNRPLLRAYLEAFRQAAGELGISAQPDLNAALSLPGMLREEDADPDPAMERLLTSALDQALSALDAFRLAEGQALAAEMLRRAAAIRVAVSRLEELRSQALPAFQSRLSARLSELLGSGGVDPQRIAQEAALLAERSDISEEITRLRVHVAQWEAILSAGGEAGKKIDFLLQEMNREANTILSKSNGLGELGLAITDAGLAIKADIDKIREQALNLE
ncbi:MAG: YicC/YloC family endoribonuclease [Bryobacteraceae bacterium]